MHLNTEQQATSTATGDIYYPGELTIRGLIIKCEAPTTEEYLDEFRRNQKLEYQSLIIKYNSRTPNTNPEENLCTSGVHTPQTN